MGTHVKMLNPDTGEVSIYSPQNALDLEQHLGWRRVGDVQVSDDYVSGPEELLNNFAKIADKKKKQPVKKKPPEEDEELDADLEE